MSASNEGQLQDYSVDQLAGAVVLVLGAVASLLLVLWQSKCLCKVNLCYIFQCERRPPNDEEMEGLKEQREKLKNKKETLIPPKDLSTKGGLPKKKKPDVSVVIETDDEFEDTLDILDNHREMTEEEKEKLKKENELL